jgi:hypothetical protein
VGEEFSSTLDPLLVLEIFRTDDTSIEVESNSVRLLVAHEDVSGICG